jgi:phage gp36-like protein
MALNLYVTSEDLIRALGGKIFQILNADAGSPIETDNRLLEALAAANAEVEDNIRHRHALPLACIPASLKLHARALAVHNLLQHRPEILSQVDRDRVEDAREYFKRLARGEISLDMPPEDQLKVSAFGQTQRIAANVSAEDLPRASAPEWFGTW